jgi:hypothetical protein
VVGAGKLGLKIQDLSSDLDKEHSKQNKSECQELRVSSQYFRTEGIRCNWSKGGSMEKGS